MAVFSEGGVTSPDIYIGVSCICLLLLSTVLNSRVFYHNYRKHSSVARTLYLCLSATDLVASCVLLGCFSVDVFKMKEKECNNNTSTECTERYFWRRVPANFEMRIYTVISFTMSFSPAHITAFLATTRFLKIKYPFLQIKLKYVIISLLLTLTWVPIIVSMAMFVKVEESKCGPVKHSSNPFAWNYCPEIFGVTTNSRGYFYTMIAVPVFLQVGAMFASILNTYELIKVYLNPVSEGAGREENRMKSSLKILLTNLGSFIHVLMIAIVAGQTDALITDKIKVNVAVMYILFQTIIPALVSALNPIIYIILTPDCNFKLINCETLRSSRAYEPRHNDIVAQTVETAA